MNPVRTQVMTASRYALMPRSPLRMTVALFLLACSLCMHRLSIHAPANLWWSALIAPDRDDLRQLLLHNSDYPRAVVSVLCGAALALAGVLMQQVLRNPLAEPTTLGVFPGAYLAVALATVFAPAWLDAGRQAIALAGAAIALGMAMAIAARRGLSTLSLILGGMIVNLCCSAVSLALAIIYYDKLELLTVWCGGVLAQQDWHVAITLAWQLAPCALCAVMAVRPLSLLDGGEDLATSLGLRLSVVRAGTLILTLVITALVVSTVGVVGFVGLAAPSLAGLMGARRLRDRLCWAPALGGALLWLADGLAQALSGTHGMLIPTGAVTALLGAPLLLLMLPRLRTSPIRLSRNPTARPVRDRGELRHPLAGVLIGVILMLAICIVSLAVGRDPSGWRINSLAEIVGVLDLRAPHLIAALAVGVLLALSGAMLQRMTGNPMASPDLLGLSAGGALGVTLMLFSSVVPDAHTLLTGCAIGCAFALAVLLVVGHRTAHAPDALLLAGLSITTLLQGVSTLSIASGNPRIMVLLNLLVGSTYGVSPAMALGVAILAMLALGAVRYLRRWLEIIPLGPEVSGALGLAPQRCRLALIVGCALMTTAATLVVGPLSFIGLMAPHMARSVGARRVVPQLYLSAAIGAGVMALSDWLARWIMFPRDMPAGIIASLAGSAYLIARMLTRERN